MFLYDIYHVVDMGEVLERHSISHIKINNIDLLKDVISFMRKNNYYDINLYFDKEGMMINQINSFNDIFVNFILNKKAFDIYDIESPISITVDADELYKALKNISNNGKVDVFINNELRITDDEKKTYKLSIHKTTHNAFSLNVGYDINIKVPSKKLADILKYFKNRVQNLSNYELVKLTTEGNKVYIEGDRGILERLKYELANNESNATEYYPLIYLIDLINIIKKSDAVELKYGEGKPLFLKMNFDNFGQLDVAIAPNML